MESIRLQNRIVSEGNRVWCGTWWIVTEISDSISTKVKVYPVSGTVEEHAVWLEKPVFDSMFRWEKYSIPDDVSISELGDMQVGGFIFTTTHGYVEIINDSKGGFGDYHVKYYCENKQWYNEDGLNEEGIKIAFKDSFSALEYVKSLDTRGKSD